MNRKFLPLKLVLLFFLLTFFSFKIVARDKTDSFQIDSLRSLLTASNAGIDKLQLLNQITEKLIYAGELDSALFKEEQLRQSAIAEEEKKRQRLFLMFVAAIAIAVAIIAAIIFRSLHITRSQKTIIEKQKQLVEEKQKAIVDSIHYARRIQQSLLPTEKFIEKSFKRLMNK